MKNTTLVIKIGNLKDDFDDVLNALESGQPATPLYQLSFKSMAGFLSCLTPKRWELLSVLRKHGNYCIRKLSGVLSRDYKNTHTDVKILLEVGLVEKDDDGLVFVPWDSLHLITGDKIEFVHNDRGEVGIEPLTRKVSEAAGILSKYKKSRPVSIEEMDLICKFNLMEEAVQEADKGVFTSSNAMRNWIASWGSNDELPPPEADVFLKENK